MSETPKLTNAVEGDSCPPPCSRLVTGWKSKAKQLINQAEAMELRASHQGEYGTAAAPMWRAVAICLSDCARELESCLPEAESFRFSSVCRSLKLENDIYRNAIEQAIVELCPRARPSQARRILRIGLGQDPKQIYNSEPDSSENA